MYEVLITYSIPFLSLVVMGIVLWRMSLLVERLSDTSHRSSRQERRDFFHLLGHFLERKDVPVSQALDLAHLHAQERNNESKMDMEVERSVQENKKVEDSESPPFFSNKVSEDPTGVRSIYR